MLSYSRVESAARVPSLPASGAVPEDPILGIVRDFYDAHHDALERGRGARRYYYSRLEGILKARVPSGQHVLEVGCGSGDLLAALQPSHGVGIDVSGRALATARARHPDLQFVEGDGGDAGLLETLGGPFDSIVLVNVVTELTDVQRTLESLRSVCHSRTRIFIYSYSRLWQPLLRLAERAGLKRQAPPDAWLPPEEVQAMLSLADYEVVRRDYQIVAPAHAPLVADFLNRYVGHLPGFEWLSLMYGIVARPAPHLFLGERPAYPSTSVIVPCRNEAGHIRSLVSRLPDLGPDSEILFVEGNSKDDTEAVLKQVIAENPDKPWRFFKQPGKGKGDAVRLGFAEARGDVVLILDSDMGVAPEDVPKFVDALVRGKGEMVNGSRMVYPMEGRAMKFLNMLANKFFAALFSWLLGQQVRDTLCGTKALYRVDYERIAANRAFFGDFDPFGDFDILFGASRLNLKIVDVAIRYHERQYGDTNISRWRHGLLLLRMSAFAARKLKFI
jgi:SAM-dependent methyltransferase